tara:strand:+ start:192 stop:350 length:159 start_codon:yes stop_codon:yes gene_type:complete
MYVTHKLLIAKLAQGAVRFKASNTIATTTKLGLLEKSMADQMPIIDALCSGK